MWCRPLDSLPQRQSMWYSFAALSCRILRSTSCGEVAERRRRCTARGSTAAVAGPGAMLVGCGKSLSYRIQSGAKLVDRGLDGRPLEPEAAVHLALEVLTRQQVVLRVLARHAAVLPLPVEVLQRERDPADAALHRHELRYPGNRWHTPPVIRLAITSDVGHAELHPEPGVVGVRAGAVVAVSKIDMSPEPMWKLTDEPSSWHGGPQPVPVGLRDLAACPRMSARRS